MAEILQHYLRASAARPFRWGTDDCAGFVTGWLELVLGQPVPRGSAAFSGDARAYAAFVATRGGLTAIAADFAGELRLRKAHAHAPGNVVVARFKDIEALGIRADDHGGVALRTPAGLAITRRAEILAEWSVPCLR